MASSIHEDAAQITETVPKPENLDATDVLKSIPTLATEHAPKGRTIDDSARGTIFWEADISDVQVPDHARLHGGGKRHDLDTGQRSTADAPGRISAPLEHR